MMAVNGVLRCWNCATDQASVSLPLSRHEFCTACGEALHTCRQCRLYDARGSGCGEPRAEVPTDPTSANFCDWFEPTTSASGAASAGAIDRRSAAERARAELEALFKPPEQG